MSTTPRSTTPGRYVRGYPKFAREMGILPEIAIFRSFALNTQNLLYLQAELTALEEALRDMEASDNANPQGKKRRYACDWFWLETSGRETNADAGQLNLVMKIREKLKEYNKALYYQAAIHKLEAPDHFDLQDMQEFLVSDEMDLALIGPDRNIWGSCADLKSYADDGLVALNPRERTDSFSSTLSKNANSVIHFFNRLHYGREKNVTTYGYRDQTVSTMTFWITGVVAAGVPAFAIAVLASASSLEIPLAAMLGCNGLIVTCLGLLTEATRKDVFLIVIVFSAMQLFFVGQVRKGGV